MDPIGKEGMGVLEQTSRHFLKKRKAMIRVFTWSIDALANGLYEFEIQYAPRAKSSMTAFLKFQDQIYISTDRIEKDVEIFAKFIENSKLEMPEIELERIKSRFIQGTISYSKDWLGNASE